MRNVRLAKSGVVVWNGSRARRRRVGIGAVYRGPGVVIVGRFPQKRVNSVMQQKIKHYAFIAAVVIIGVGPGLAKDFAGLNLPAWAHAMSALVSIAGMVKLYLMPKAGFALIPSDQSPNLPSVPPAPLAMLCLALCLGATGCTKAQGDAIISDVNRAMPAFACVFGELLAGDTDPLTIAPKCGNLALSDLQAILSTLLQGPPVNAKSDPLVQRAHSAYEKTVEAIHYNPDA